MRWDGQWAALRSESKSGEEGCWLVWQKERQKLAERCEEKHLESSWGEQKELSMACETAIEKEI